MPKIVARAALIAHGGAGGRAPSAERGPRRQGLIEAVERGAAILRGGGIALDAVVATVAALEDNGLFNAGYGSVLTTAGRVEMDAAVMVAEPEPPELVRTARNPQKAAHRSRAGGVVLVSRVLNPIMLARAVMERTPHLLMGGAGAERLARQAGIRLCRPEQLVSERARQRWLAAMEARRGVPLQSHGTVGAVALDAHGSLAAATSTGGVSAKMPGRIGDSAIVGAGLFAGPNGAASATGTGEAILKVGLCRLAIDLAARSSSARAALSAIRRLYAATGGEAGVVMVDASGRLGYAHNAQAMEVAMFERGGKIRHVALEPSVKRPAPN
ncbi:MAG TPA: isoaspartyl peptidase/L-asparaginase [Candidatus Binataceae bacterium]|nr:isoaspartyl peptidase/L-asparaginase [Candidatus Binataceae bacterium]